MEEKTVHIIGLKGDEQAALAATVLTEALEQLGYEWDYDETSPDCSEVKIVGIRKA